MKGYRSVARVVLIGLFGAVALSAVPAPAAAGDAPRWTPFVRVDNDVFGGTDRAYTNGFQLGFTSPTVTGFGDEKLSPRLRGLNRRLQWLQPRGFPENNVAFAIGQAMFTPDEPSLREPDPLDRPYAGMLLAGVTYNSRDGRRLRSTSLDVGLVGPSALAEQTQDFVHDSIGADEFLGWDQQLRDEPVARVVHQRMRKWNLRAQRGMADAIGHYGGSLGNVATFANAGAELRFGRWLPDDFGTAPTRAQGVNTAPSRGLGSGRRMAVHGFLNFDARWVLYDITLDGNTWRDSPSVDREAFVAEAAIGFATHWHGWKISAGRYFRTKEFETETSNTTYGRLAFQREIRAP